MNLATVILNRVRFGCFVLAIIVTFYYIGLLLTGRRRGTDIRAIPLPRPRGYGPQGRTSETPVRSIISSEHISRQESVSQPSSPPPVSSEDSTHRTSTTPTVQDTRVPSEPSTPFLYLLQTESCIPDRLKSAKIMGSPRACRCDVLILSYKEECQVTPLVHMKYIFANSSTSWASGRNMLFQQAMNSTKKYFFYIFIDDDVILKLRAGVKSPQGNYWRMFEDFLMRVQPAIGIVDPTNNVMLTEAQKGRKKRQCTWSESSDYLPVSRYDPAFSAFHYQAIEYLLPYPNQFDNISWYYAELQVEIKSEIIFAGQSVVHTNLLAVNPKHRPYTKKLPELHEWKMFVDAIVDDLPERYHNVSLLWEWKRDGLEHGWKSSTLCLPPPPPKMPIKPFAYLDEKL